MAREFTLSITLGNDAMQTPQDVARALEYIVMRLHRGADMGNIKDINGNNVGSFEGEFEDLEGDE
jgi:hypothetical protein